MKVWWVVEENEIYSNHKLPSSYFVILMHINQWVKENQHITDQNIQDLGVVGCYLNRGSRWLDQPTFDMNQIRPRCK